MRVGVRKFVALKVAGRLTVMRRERERSGLVEENIGPIFQKQHLH